MSSLDKDRFSPEVRSILEAGGWYQGRSVAVVEVDSVLELFPAAREVLQEFGGLRFGRSVWGRQGDDIDFRTSMLADDLYGYAKELLIAGKKLGSNSKVYPVAQFVNLHCELILDDRGRAYDWQDDLIPLARSMDHALELILLGGDLRSGF